MRRSALGLSAATLTAALFAAGAALAEGDPDPVFMEKALKGDNSEIALGALAARRAASPAVRDYGRVLERDHATAKMQAAPVARQVGAHPTSAMMEEARQEYAKLKHMHGADFDHEFARYMVDDHRHDIADFQAKANGSGPVADLARQTLPVLQKHLHLAEQLAH